MALRQANDGIAIAGYRPGAALTLSTPAKRVWIDIDNSPHVPFFIPIIEALRMRGTEITLTARNMYQTSDLLKFFGLPCNVIGGHCGKNTLLKVWYNCSRAAQLLPIAARGRFDAAISHGSRAQVLVCKALKIPAIMMHDYEHSQKTGFIEPEWILMPDIIPPGAMTRRPDHVLTYPGLKEDVYVPRFCPDPSILADLGVDTADILVTVRPPATDSHYHQAETDVLFAETMQYLASDKRVRIVVVPRNGRQKQRLLEEWGNLMSTNRMVIPKGAVNGLNLIWHSDLVISAGGTMNREAAALGVPVYSIFRGRIGAVDENLALKGRLTLVGSRQELRSKIALVKWDRPVVSKKRDNPTLDTIIHSILTIIGVPTEQGVAVG